MGTWTTYNEVENKVDREAQNLASLYRDVSSYPEPSRTALRNDLRAYVKQVIEVSWPEQRRGIFPVESAVMMDALQTDLVTFEPTTTGQQVLHTEAYKQFNELVESRRSRLDSVTASIPQSLWTLVILGALVSITVTLFFDTRSFAMHFWMRR